MGLLKTLTDKIQPEKDEASAGWSPEKSSRHQTTLYKTPTGTGSRNLDGPFPGHDLRDATLIACLLAGYPDHRTRQIYAQEVGSKLALPGAPPLTNLDETAYHAYQRAQTKRVVSYKDAVMGADPLKHRFRADQKYFQLVNSELEAGSMQLKDEVEQWRYVWQDVVQTLITDAEAEKASDPREKATLMTEQAERIGQSLDNITDEQMCDKIKEKLSQRVRYEQSLKQFDAEAPQRRAKIAENGGARGEAGYKRPDHVIAKAERERGRGRERSPAAPPQLEGTSTRDFATE